MGIVTSARFATGIAAFALGATVALAQAPVRPPYGNAISLETAKKVALGAMAEAKKQSWNVAVAIVDNHGMLIYFEMKDDTQTASADVAIGEGAYRRNLAATVEGIRAESHRRTRRDPGSAERVAG